MQLVLVIAVPVGAFDAFPQESVAVLDVGCFQVDSPSVGLETMVTFKGQILDSATKVSSMFFLKEFSCLSEKFL